MPDHFIPTLNPSFKRLRKTKLIDFFLFISIFQKWNQTLQLVKAFYSHPNDIYASSGLLSQWTLLKHSKRSWKFAGREEGAAAVSTNTTPAQEVDPKTARVSEALIQLADTGEWVQGLSLLKAARQRKLIPSGDAYAAVINSCRHALQFDRAYAVYRDFQTTFPSDPITPLSARSILDEHASSLEKAMAVVKTMQRNGAPIDQKTITLLIAHCNLAKDWQLGLHIFHWGMAQNIKTDGDIFNALVDMLSTAGKRSIANTLYDENTQKGRKVLDVHKPITIGFDLTCSEKFDELVKLQKGILDFIGQEFGVKVRRSSKDNLGVCVSMYGWMDVRQPDKVTFD